ncbi:MAG: thermonuclease family protein [Prochlorotrichaceae cyanobacterium]
MINSMNRLYRNVTLLRAILRCCSVLILCSALTLSSCQTLPMPKKGYWMNVQEVVNGNTLEAIGVEAIGGEFPDWQGQRVRIRLIGIDAPDLDQDPWGKAAQQFVAEQVGLGSSSRLPPSDRLVLLSFDTQIQDGYDRLLAYVWTDQGLLNETIVAAGQALANSYFPNVRYEEVLGNAQHKARLLGLGIWDPEQPLRESPAEFRRRRT